MDTVEELVAASQRDNTRRSYEAGIRHFEIEGRGLLPATASSVATYLASFAAVHSINTLLQRLAALSRWHGEHGFDDPTKAPLVRQVVRGIRSTYPAREKQARPMAVELVERADDWLQAAVQASQNCGDRAGVLRHTRDRSLVLLGFWRGFRSDELVGLRAEHVEVSPGQGLICYLGKSKNDRSNLGRSFQCPALSRMCPVTALSEWLALSGITAGPLYRRIDRWGTIHAEALHPNSVIPILRQVLQNCEVLDSQSFSSHSLRRGFANWARDSGWDLKDLMSYVGWRDVKSAMRYLETSTDALRGRFERGLPQLSERNQQAETLSASVGAAIPPN